MKLGVIGAGNVGDVVSYTAAMRGIASHIYLYDKRPERTESVVKDLSDARGFYPKDVRFFMADLKEIAQCEIVVISIGLITENVDRLEELKMNKEGLSTIIPQLMEYGFNGHFVVITNPCDIIAYYVHKLSGLPASRVISTGTALDSARLNCVLADYLGVSQRSVNGLMLGEHGDSQFVAWSQIKVFQQSLDEYVKSQGISFDKEQLELNVRFRGRAIFKGKRCTQYGIANTSNQIIAAITNDSKEIINVSTLFTGQYGLENIYVSTPCVVGKDGVEKIIELDISDEERKKMHDSVALMRKHMENNGI